MSRMTLGDTLGRESGELRTLIQVLAVCLEQQTAQAAAIALVNKLASKFSCQRVSVGFIASSRIGIAALSHSAQVDPRSNLIRDLLAAMEEAVDQDRTISYPTRRDAQPYIHRAHDVLSQCHGSAAICTLPLTCENQVVGAITLERAGNQPFDQATVSLCEQAATLLGPILDLKHREDRWLIAKAWYSLRHWVMQLVGAGHLGLKIWAGSFLTAALALAFATGDYRVSANAVLEPVIRRAVVAPVDGYVAEAPRRAGDLVQAGDALCTLDDKDLTLEAVKWESEAEQIRQKYRSALAMHDRAEIAVLKAQLDQANAQLELTRQHLARTHMAAPFDGVVVSGDLSQSLGSPVERGDVLFEIAPLGEFRAILNVDERDIDRIELAQTGSLVLAGLPAAALSITVTKITPVSVAKDGGNYFRVEARLDHSPELLRPGMKGIGKVHIGERKLVWIWTHGLYEWLRYWFWSLGW